MILEGDKSVIDAIKEKKRLLDNGEEHGHIRPLLLICGGLMRGVYGGSAVTVLQEKGYGEVFDDVVGVSTGAPTAAYFLGGNPRVGNSIYYKECCSGRFLKATRLSSWLRHPIETWKNSMNLDYLDGVFKGATNKGINIKRVFKNRTKLHIAVTREVNAESWYINTCVEEKLQQAVIASCDIPGTNSYEYRIEEEVCVDGVVGEAFPLSFVKGMDPQPTHVLVISNSAKEGLSRLAELIDLFIFNIVFRQRCSAVIRRKFLARNDSFYKLLADLKSAENKSIALIWTDSYLSAITTDSKKVKQAAEMSETWWLNLLSETT